MWIATTRAFLTFWREGPDWLVGAYHFSDVDELLTQCPGAQRVVREPKPGSPPYIYSLTPYLFESLVSGLGETVRYPNFKEATRAAGGAGRAEVYSRAFEALGAMGTTISEVESRERAKAATKGKQRPLFPGTPAQEQDFQFRETPKRKRS